MAISRDDSGQASKRRRIVLLGVICLGLVGAVGYNFWSSKQNEVKPYVRTVSDFIVTWRCLECGHSEDGRGETSVRTCPQCGKEALYVSIRHACPTHGVFPVAFKYDENFDPAQIKIGEGEWVPYADEDFNSNLLCPRCGKPMMPAETSRPAPREAP
jgi:hypothetical protein